MKKGYFETDFWDDLDKNGTNIVFEVPDFNDIDKDFVKKLRSDLGYSQQVFANAIGVTKKAVEKWEQGKNPVKGATARLLYLISDNNEVLKKIYKAYVEYPQKSNVKANYIEKIDCFNQVEYLCENEKVYKREKQNDYDVSDRRDPWTQRRIYQPLVSLDIMSNA